MQVVRRELLSAMLGFQLTGQGREGGADWSYIKHRGHIPHGKWNSSRGMRRIWKMRICRPVPSGLLLV